MADKDVTLERIRHRLELRRKTRLCPLVFLGNWESLHPSDDIQCTLFVGEGSSQREVDASLRRTENGKVQLRIYGDLPGEPLALLVGDFYFWEFDASPTELQLSKDQEPAPPAEVDWQAKFEALQAAAPVGALGGESLGAEGEREIDIEDDSNPALSWVLNQSQPSIDITVSVSEHYICHGKEIAVVEFWKDASNVHCVCPLDLADGPSKLTATVAHGELDSIEDISRVTVRPLSKRDLDLLSPRRVIGYLANQDYVTLPVEYDDAALSFHVDHAEHHVALAADSCLWILQVSVVNQEDGR